MKSDGVKWDRRYRNANHPTTPSEIVSRFFPLAPIGKGLDIAAGNGRNATFLSENGFFVDAVDISIEGLSSIDKSNSRVHRIHADLDHFLIPAGQYDLIVNINFLQRKLFQPIVDGLKEQGLLIFQTFLDEKKSLDRSMDEDFSHFLAPNELIKAFSCLRVLYYNETTPKLWHDKTRQIASLVARKLSR